MGDDEVMVKDTESSAVNSRHHSEIQLCPREVADIDFCVCKFSRGTITTGRQSGINEALGSLPKKPTCKSIWQKYLGTWEQDMELHMRLHNYVVCPIWPLSSLNL